MKKYLSLSLVFVLSLSVSKVYAVDEPATTSCETLGYTTPYDDCVRENGMPLVCPFYSLDKKMVLCIKESCRGYSLTDKDLDALASDGKKVREHIASLNECVVGFGNDAKTYYQVKECKSGSLYQNGICDVGCLQARYPYNQHPGDLPGDVEECVDTAGKWYGYYACNQGWVGGWRDSQSGYCNFGTCSIKDYPYTSNPNINSFGEDVNRGATLICKIGSSTYYRYTAVDKDGNQLTSNVCGISNNYTLSRGACRKQCVFDNCTSSVKTNTRNGYSFSFNEFTCSQKTTDCRIGDTVVIDGVEVGVIISVPKNSSERLNIIQNIKMSNYWADGVYERSATPLPQYWSSNCQGDLYGKYNSKFLLTYMNEKNKTVSEGEKYYFPAFEDVNQYAPSGCENIPVCAKGEWYIATCGELKSIYENRYLLYNATDSTNFISGSIGSSSDAGEYYNMLYLEGASWNGNIWWVNDKQVSRITYFPMLSFYVR